MRDGLAGVEVIVVGRPRFFTVEEAARVLRIGRTAAYAGAKRYRETGGAEGIKVIAIGGSLRVPGAWLEEMAGGPVDLDDLPAPVASLEAKRAEPRPTPATARPARAKTRTSRPPDAGTGDQTALPFTG